MGICCSNYRRITLLAQMDGAVAHQQHTLCFLWWATMEVPASTSVSEICLQTPSWTFPEYLTIVCLLFLVRCLHSGHHRPFEIVGGQRQRRCATCDYRGRYEDIQSASRPQRVLQCRVHPGIRVLDHRLTNRSMLEFERRCLVCLGHPVKATMGPKGIDVNHIVCSVWPVGAGPLCQDAHYISSCQDHYSLFLSILCYKAYNTSIMS